MHIYSDVGTRGVGEGQGGSCPPQYLADQSTLCQLGEGRLSPPITTVPSKFFHLPASLMGNLILKLTTLLIFWGPEEEI